MPRQIFQVHVCETKAKVNSLNQQLDIYMLDLVKVINKYFYCNEELNKCQKFKIEVGRRLNLTHFNQITSSQIQGIFCQITMSETIPKFRRKLNYIYMFLNNACPSTVFHDPRGCSAQQSPCGLFFFKSRFAKGNKSIFVI